MPCVHYAKAGYYVPMGLGSFHQASLGFCLEFCPVTCKQSQAGREESNYHEGSESSETRKQTKAYSRSEFCHYPTKPRSRMVSNMNVDNKSFPLDIICDLHLLM